MIKRQLQGFVDFIREQGVINLSVAFLLGGAVSKTVSSLVTDIINPFLSIVLGATENLKDRYIQVYEVKIMYGNFLNNLTDFLVIALVIYFLLKLIRIDRFDKKKDANPPPKSESKPEPKSESKPKAESSQAKDSAPAKG